MYRTVAWARSPTNFLLLAIGLLAACQAEPEEVEVIITKVVTETIVEEGETVEVTRIVEVPVTVVAEAPEPVVEEVVQEEGPSGQLKISETSDIITVDPKFLKGRQTQASDRTKYARKKGVIQIKKQISSRLQRWDNGG